MYFQPDSNRGQPLEVLGYKKGMCLPPETAGQRSVLKSSRSTV